MLTDHFKDTRTLFAKIRALFDVKQNGRTTAYYLAAYEKARRDIGPDVSFDMIMAYFIYMGVV